MRAIPQKVLDELGESLDWRSIFLENTYDQHITCPRHEDTNPSLFIDTDHAYCFGGGCETGWYGGLGAAILYLEIEHGLPHDKISAKHVQGAVRKLHHLVRTGKAELQPPEQARAQKRTAPLPTQQIMSWMGAMKDEHYGWLFDQYAIDREAAIAAHLGFTGTAISIPHADIHGKIWDVKFRFYEYPGFEGEPNLRYWSVNGGRPRNLFPGWALSQVWATPEDVQVGVVEAELDALSLLSRSDHVGLALPNGSGTKAKRWVALWKHLAQYSVPVHLLLDNDTAGDTATERLLGVLSEFGVQVRDSRELLDGAKDVAEYYVERRRSYEKIQI